MSKFNVAKKPNKTKTYEGGDTYVKNPLEEWMNFLFSSKMDNGFYKTSSTQQNRFIDLTKKVIEKYGATFVAKCAFFARNELGMRSASQLVAAMLNDETFDRKRQFFKNFMHRADDPAEVFAAVDMLNSKRSHALIRGTSDFISSLGEYQIMKYQMKNKRYNMYDIVNIVHPKSKVVDDFKNNRLAPADTWEVGISTGSTNFKTLVEQKKLGYLALIRNINNLFKENVDKHWIQTILCPQLTNPTTIKKSLVFPYQIYTTYKNLNAHNFDVDHALDEAFIIACGNMPKLNGKSLVMLDVSGSMDDKYGDNSILSIKQAGACYAAALCFNSHCDFVKFGNNAKRLEYFCAENAFGLIDKMCENDNCGYGTDISSAFKMIANKKYDRIFLISDMQTITTSVTWVYSVPGIDTYNKYCAKNGRTLLYSFDLGNYRSQVVNPNNPNVHLMTTLNDHVFKMLKYIESGGNLYNYINDNFNF